MTENEAIFKAKATIKSADIEHRQKINFNIGKYNKAVPNGELQFADLNLAKERAKNIKWRALETLDQHLEEFEMQFSKRGGKVIWAQNSQEALDEILAICKEKNCKTIVKSKSMVTEEIHLNAFLEKNGIESVETDLGEYIQQLDGEPPYHILTPALHKNKEDVARIFEEKLGAPSKLSIAEMTQVARKNLREKFVQAEIGITGANFIIADIGGIALTENEGNARLSSSFPQTHIVIAGIEKMIPSITDLSLLWPLLSTYGSGQKVSVYNSIICGPKQTGEMDGPEEMYVIF
jgi:L-lactate dehydrogenase complex protein LldF